MNIKKMKEDIRQSQKTPIYWEDLKDGIHLWFVRILFVGGAIFVYSCISHVIWCYATDTICKGVNEPITFDRKY